MTGTISFARGAPSLDIIDVEGLEAAAAQAFVSDPGGMTAYGTAVGYLPLREWIAEHHQVAPEQVFVTNGSMQADAFLFDALVTKGDTVVVERPTYDRTLLSLRNRGADVRMIELEPDGIDTAALERVLATGAAPKLAHIIPNFQNPAGYTLSRTKRERLLELARSHGFTIFEDDPYVALRFAGDWLPTMLSMDGDAVVYASSFSKTVCPGIRVGYLVGPEEVIAKIVKIATTTYISPSMVSQAIVNQFCRSGAIERSIQTVREALRDRAETLCNALAEHLPDARFVPPEGGYFLWVDLPDGTDVAALFDAAAARGVQFVKGTDFVLEGAESSLRLAYSGVTPAQIEEGVKRLADAYGEVQTPRMRREEVRALGELAGEAAAGIAGQVRDVHAGVAQRVFGSLRVLGAAAEPVRLIHDGVSAGAYAAARTLTGAVVRGGATAFSLTLTDDNPSISDSVPGRMAVGAINGMWGDRLNGRRSVLETPMAIRSGGRDVPLTPDSLARAFPDATPKIAVFAHGLCETDDAWRLGADRSVPYGDRLRAELGYTPVYIRYNSGLHISVNGRALARLLDALTVVWPVEIAEIALIGHSMGGLVSRGACHYAADGSWRDRVRHVVSLGAPHKGAPLELAANAACHAASRLPETRPFATPIKIRAPGVKDLGYGYVVDEDWKGHDADAFWTNTGTEVPFLESANHYFVSATLSRDPEAPLGRLIGDLLVLRRSAWSQQGRGQRLQFPVDRYTHVGGANHFDLLNHPAVYAQIRKWLGERRELPAPAAA